MADNFITTEIDDRIAIVRFDRGDKANALSIEAIRQLTEAARAFHARPDVSAVVLAGRADNFTLGADLKDPARAAQKDHGLSQRRLSLRAGPEMCEAWEKIDGITIMAIEGWCVGGGAALAVACDLRVMAKSARLYVPEVARGMNMSWGSIPRMTALVGPARAKRLAALCEKVDAETALAWAGGRRRRQRQGARARNGVCPHGGGAAADSAQDGEARCEHRGARAVAGDGASRSRSLRPDAAERGLRRGRRLVSRRPAAEIHRRLSCGVSRRKRDGRAPLYGGGVHGVYGDE
ncbi:MAG: enoyl-CoA hydratase/isomerase family protein [Hyphomonadaceae bacterium]